MSEKLIWGDGRIGVMTERIVIRSSEYSIVGRESVDRESGYWARRKLSIRKRHNILDILRGRRPRYFLEPLAIGRL